MTIQLWGRFRPRTGVSLVVMQIRPMTEHDLDDVTEIDATIHSPSYLHVDQTGDDLGRSWRLERRPRREKLVQPNPLDDDARFYLKQILTGAEEGGALVADYNGEILAFLMQRLEPETRTMRVIDLRVDFDRRREGIGSALVFQAIREAREQSLRAVLVETLTDNAPANEFLQRCGFELTGIDLRRWSNHDLVKEAVALFWYAPLD